ncbi:MAG: alpha/beta fold hydrolase [Planctomycetota bacterium]
MPEHHTDHESWHIPGADGMPVFGVCHRPPEGVTPRGTVLVVHGFLGYMDYGMLPALTESIASAGFIAHRFNLSHSGVTLAYARFRRPDLFERDTWNKQRTDVRAVISACRQGRLPGTDRIGLLGHSRGGVTALRAAGCSDRNARPELLPDAAFTASAPSACCSLDTASQKDLLKRGFREVVSRRTKQTLRVGAGWLGEQLDDPEQHDLQSLCAQIRERGIATRIVHGARDVTVPPNAAERLAEWTKTDPVLIAGGDHVFNTPNPFNIGDTPSTQLAQLIEQAVSFFAVLEAAPARG